MLEPKQDRLCYGEELTPPDGFDFDSAIATTYSLDLNALLAVPIALCFKNTLDGDLKGEKLALLEVLGQIKGKVKVFYQKGNISFPTQFNRLYTFLEPCLQAIVPEGGAFSSFHPKLWLLRFVESVEGKKMPEVRYRLIVLSRNLTFDRSWDVAVTLEGTLSKIKTKQANMSSWLTFIRKLLALDKSFKPAANMLKELENIEWALPQHFTDYQLMIGGGALPRPLHFESQQYDELLVVSPFLKSAGGGVSALDWLASYAGDNKRFLFSRAEELNAVGAKKLVAWQCYAMNSLIVNGEESHELGDANQQEIKIQNLHAKLIVAQKGTVATWHIGSANSTTAAMGDSTNTNPRNTEAMLMLKGTANKTGIQVLKQEWMPEKGLQIFIKHEFSDLESEQDDSNADLLREVLHQLISANWHLTATLDSFSKTYTLKLTSDLKELNKKVNILVGQLDVAGYKELASEMIWEQAKLTSISALIPVRVKVYDSDIEKKLIIESKLVIEGGDTRLQQIMKDMVDTPAKVMDYIRLLLQLTPDKSQWLEFDSQRGEAGVSGFILSSSPILEQLLIASSRHPQVLKRIQTALKGLQDAGAIIPDEFKMLWAHFEKEIRK
jgi:hypothetical protein